jgi:hypothetical protein
MITWAAVLLLQGVEDGMTHQDGMAFSSRKAESPASSNALFQIYTSSKRISKA